MNEFAGVGFTYKFIDADISLSLPKTCLINQDLQNLSQIWFALSYTGRQWVVRGYYSDMKGLIMPGYGFTLKSQDGNFFLAPMVFAGPGIAFNFYKGTLGDFAYTNWELGGMVALNLGYNHSHAYVNIRAMDEVNYIPLNPSYFIFTHLRLTMIIGYRFYNLEKFVPVSFP